MLKYHVNWLHNISLGQIRYTIVSSWGYLGFLPFISTVINKVVIDTFVHKDFYIYIQGYLLNFSEVKLLGQKPGAFLKIHTAELLSKIVLVIYHQWVSKGKENIRKHKK